MNTKKLFNKIIKIVLPLLLGSAILYWMYRGFDFSSISYVLLHEMNWTWMIISLPFGILAQAFRGWRWKQSLEPIGEHARSSVCVNSIFLSYAVSLLIPRIGEFARCGVLNRYDKVAFPKAIGTVVTERAVDTLIVILITSIAFVMQIGVFSNFFSRTGTRIDDFLGMFSATGWLVTAICGIASLILFYNILRHLSIYKKVKEMLSGIWQGINSLRRVKNIPLFLFYSIAIWGSYFLHYYLTFYCFPSTAHLGLSCALVSFVVGSIAVIVPTPNGAGPWHLVILLGIYAWVALNFTKPYVSLDSPAKLTRPIENV